MNKRILHIYSQMRNWCNNVTNTTASIIGTILHKVLNMEAIFRHVYINIDIHRFICTCFIFKHCIKHKINNRSDCVLKRESEKRNAALDLKYKHCSTTKLTFFPSICRIKKAPPHIPFEMYSLGILEWLLQVCVYCMGQVGWIGRSALICSVCWIGDRVNGVVVVTSCHFTSECRWFLNHRRRLTRRAEGFGSDFWCASWTRPCQVCLCLLVGSLCGALPLNLDVARSPPREPLEPWWWTNRSSGCRTKRPSSARTAVARSWL